MWATAVMVEGFEACAMSSVFLRATEAARGLIECGRASRPTLGCGVVVVVVDVVVVVVAVAVVVVVVAVVCC